MTPDGSDWYQTVSGKDEIKTEQNIINKKTGKVLVHNNAADYADKQDCYWKLGIKTDSGMQKEELRQESYITIDDPNKRNALLKELDKTNDILYKDLGGGRIKVIF